MIFIILTTRHFEVFNQHMDFCIDTVVPPILVILRLTKHISCFVVPCPAGEIFSTTPEQNISLSFEGSPPSLVSTPYHPGSRACSRCWAGQPSAHKRELHRPLSERKTCWPLCSLTSADHFKSLFVLSCLYNCQYTEVFPRQQVSNNALIT